MSKSFVHEFNKVDIRNTYKRCRCKVCDKEIVEDEKVVYLKSFRLSSEPFHICIPCWRDINNLVESEVTDK